MDRQEELALLGELVDLSAAGSTFQDDTIDRSPVDRYLSQDVFTREQDRIFKRAPWLVAHTSELDGPGAFITADIMGLPILLTRGADDAVSAFLNVCRHRGARLEGAASGCKKRFSCPYHAWTYKNDGTLMAVPHEAQGFPDLDKTAHSLKRVPVAERDGLIWIMPHAQGGEDDRVPAEFLDQANSLMGWLGLSDHVVVDSTTRDIDANWKILVEGGIEAYHFKVTHRNTIGPHFMNNLSSYQMFGRNMRSVLPRESLKSMADLPREEWAIRHYSNILYTLFPANQFLVIDDHVAWITQTPLSPGKTRVRMTTLASKAEIDAKGREHFLQNHGITTVTLKEDFDIGEGIQAGLNSGANDTLTFGRFEGALAAFNAAVEDAMAQDISAA